jgi:hypothetical protein
MSGFVVSVRRPPPLAKTNGKPTKRIVRTLRAECVGGNKTNHPGKGNNGGGLGGLMEDPISTQITAFFAYMPGVAKESGH